MKFFIICLISIITVIHGEDQNCSSSPYFKEGTKMKYNSLNMKGKVTSSSISTVVSVQNENDVMVSKVTSQVLDKKGEETFESEFVYRCKGNQIELDIISLMNDLFAKQKASIMEVEGEGVFSFPANLEEGMTFEDQQVFIKYTIEGNPMELALTIDITDRKIIGTESVSTDAGTFDCYLISQTVGNVATLEGMKMPMMSNELVQYYNNENGMIKQATKNKSGSIISTSVLVNIE